MVDFDGILSSDSKVCKQCYDFHQQVLHLHNSPQSTPVLALDDIVAQLEGKIEQLEGSKNELISDKEYLEWVVCKVTLKLVKTLQQDEAMLLPELHSHFCDVVSKTIQNFPNVQKSLKTSLPTNRWLLSSISNYLQDNLGIVCKNKRYGTLLYRKNGDLLKASHFRRLASHFRRLYVILKWHFTYMFNSKQVLTKQLAVSFKLTLYFLNFMYTNHRAASYPSSSISPPLPLAHTSQC